MTECVSIYRQVVAENDTSEIIRAKIQLGLDVKVHIYSKEYVAGVQCNGDDPQATCISDHQRKDRRRK